MSLTLQPFQLAVPDEILADLASRLARTRLPELPPSTGWPDGCHPAQFSAFLDYWRTQFDWRAFEARVNRWPQFLTTIDGAEIHFLRIAVPSTAQASPGEPAAPPAIPLLLLHGWPGSFVEFLALAELLAASEEGVRFELVIPSLPGFGYSRRAADGPMGLHRTAEIFAQLMRGLEHERFFVQGGDFGAGVGSALALRHPDAVIGLHLNYIPGSYRPFVAADAPPTPDENAFLTAVVDWLERKGAYSHLHRTRPHALSIGLHDSPAGLAAWILEKFASWADCDGHLDRLPRELLAANLTLYWVTASLATSIEFYRDVRDHPFHLAPGERITPPCSIAHFPREAPVPPRSWVERGYNVVRWTDQPRGGHFAALEAPELLARDIRAFVTSIAPAIPIKPACPLTAFLAK